MFVVRWAPSWITNSAQPQSEVISDDINLIQSLQIIRINTTIKNIDVIKLSHLERVIVPRNCLVNGFISMDKLKNFKLNNPNAQIGFDKYNKEVGFTFQEFKTSSL